MSESANAQPYLSADFGKESGRHDWMTHEDLVNWISTLRDQWSWINQQGQAPTQQAWHTISKNLNNAINALQQAQTHRSQGQTQHADNQIASAKSTLENLVRTRSWLLPNSAQRHFVEELRDSGKLLEAALIVANWMGQDLSGVPIRSVVNALLQWEFYERGIKDRVKSEGAVLKRLAGDMQTTLTNYQESELRQTKRFDELHGHVSDQSAQQQAAFDETQQTWNTQWKAQLSEAQAELDRLKETYDKHMALAAPVEYWETKRKRHGRWSAVAFIAIVTGMGTGAYFLHSELQSIGQVIAAGKVVASAAHAQSSEPSTLQSLAQSATTWHLGSFILLATLSFWFIRLLVRIFLSNLHLENDASERVTMVKTYLALLRNDDLPKGDSINTVLAALFRPSGDGIVKDEGVPPSTLEWFTKLGGR